MSTPYRAVRNVVALCAVFLFFGAAAFGSALIIETDMGLSGISYSNLDYDNNTSTDAVSFYAQRLRLGVGGKFAPGVEIMARLQTLEVVGSSASVLPSELARFLNHPYPDITGRPFVENLYFKVTNIADYPAEITVGRQPLDVAGGLVSDNTAGINALRLKVDYPEKLTSEIFTAKISEGFYADTDFDIYGLELSYKLDKDVLSLAYVAEQDSSGALYDRGAVYTTTRIDRNFMKASLRRKDEFGEYGASYARQSGGIGIAGGGTVALDGYAWELGGLLKAKDTKVGAVSAGLFLTMFSGDDDTLSLGDKDSEFRPSRARRYDGLEPWGHGRLFAASYNEAAIELPAGYSGINTIGVRFDFAPFYGWNFGVDYYLFSASEHPLKPQKEASGFERLLGGQYSLGAEMDLRAAYRINKHIDAGFGYYRYTPPSEIFWTKIQPLSKYSLDFRARF